MIDLAVTLLTTGLVEEITCLILSSLTTALLLFAELLVSTWVSNDTSFLIGRDLSLTDANFVDSLTGAPKSPSTFGS